jgi:hypothetical protein
MADSADPVSWFLIEAGWKVVDRDGAEVGAVDEIVGDSSNDIFNGLAISTTLLGKPRYVPAERVGTITEGRIHLTLSQAEIERLGEYEEPPTSAEILPESAGVVRRAEASVEAPIRTHEESMPFVRRFWFALRRLVGR